MRIAFPAPMPAAGAELLAQLEAARARCIAAHPGVTMGFTGGNITARRRARRDPRWHAAVEPRHRGARRARARALFRSATLLILLVGALGVATLYAFGAAALTVGHLNAATAFLGAIIAGNGINYGILLIARFLEERREASATDAGVDGAFADAIVGTLRPTAVASLGASIAYGSLAATSFKGFADFAVIGAIGMTLCWLASYLLLPALVLRFGRHTRVVPGQPGRRLDAGERRRLSPLGRRVPGRRPRSLLASAGVTYRYVAADPFEYDIKRLRSEGADAVLSRDAWTSCRTRSSAAATPAGPTSRRIGSRRCR